MASWCGRTSRRLSVGDQLFEFFDDERGTAGDVAGELLHGEQRALASAVADGVCDFGAAVGAGERDGVDRDRKPISSPM